MTEVDDSPEGGRQSLQVLYRDEALVVIMKPPGAVIHRTRDVPRDTLILPRVLGDELGLRVFPVHRLDRPTSGVLVFALSSAIASAMAGDIQSRQWKKRYVGLARGPIADATRVDYAVPEGDKRREARTDFEPVETFHGRYTLLRAYPQTGRYHQIRRHLRHLRHPLVGDTNYGDGKVNRFFRETLGLRRLFLHAERLEFPHPAESRRLCIDAPLAPDLATVLEALRRHTGLVA